MLSSTDTKSPHVKCTAVDKVQGEVDRGIESRAWVPVAKPGCFCRVINPLVAEQVVPRQKKKK